jgi:hypothetical protein
VIGFNEVLRSEGVNPADVKLVRHQDTRASAKTTPYRLWHTSHERFELYQKIQRRLVFTGARLIASFVATALDETLFVGLYENKGLGKADTELIDPVSGKDVGGYHFYDLVMSSKLDSYRGRLIVDWGSGYRSWVQLARKKDKTVVEIRRSVSDPPFPGFMAFCEPLTELATMPTSWREALSAVSGVYLLIDPKTGKQYVGSARGAERFWGRWENYIASGHGGNLKMKELPRADYQVCILEVASSSASNEDIFNMEERWKRKLLSKRFGLNS